MLELRSICMRLNEYKLYLNANNCGFCLKQLEYLGGNANFIDVVHCDDSKNIRECSNLNAMPQWRKKDKIFPGARLSIASLRELLYK